jgi:hypothetical protein
MALVDDTLKPVTVGEPVYEEPVHAALRSLKEILAMKRGIRAPGAPP